MIAPTESSSSADAKTFFRKLENLTASARLPLDEILDRLCFNDQGLIPAIAQDAKSGVVLMLAWMNRESLELTMATGQMTYWSRSRQALWIKGKTSGCLQTMVSARLDCDGDALLFSVDQSGGACHTGRRSCFYFAIDPVKKEVRIVSDPAS